MSLLGPVELGGSPFGTAWAQKLVSEVWCSTDTWSMHAEGFVK